VEPAGLERDRATAAAPSARRLRRPDTQTEIAKQAAVVPRMDRNSMVKSSVVGKGGIGWGGGSVWTAATFEALPRVVRFHAQTVT